MSQVTEEEQQDWREEFKARPKDEAAKSVSFRKIKATFTTETSSYT
jgi:hypothetical protein